jgi:hypothetical protein
MRSSSLSRLLSIFFLIFIISGFTQTYAQTNWEKYPDNPVLEGLNMMGPSVLYDGEYYHMWYDDIPSGNTRRIYHAQNFGGHYWITIPGDPVLDVGLEGEIDDEEVAVPNVILDGSTYKMYYLCYDGERYRIGYATSPDGIEWTKSESNPVLEGGGPGSWDLDVWAATVIFSGSAYEMWYTGMDDMYDSRIGYAISNDGVTWSKYEDPVLDLGPNGSFDDHRVGEPYVIRNGDNYQMWYHSSDDLYHRVGYATSTNGTDWEKYDEGNPVLDLGEDGEWDDERATGPSVLIEGSTYHMWYFGYDGDRMQIGYAVDSTGVVGIGDEEVHIPFSISLGQNHPNPFNPSTTIDFSVPNAPAGKHHVTMTVYNIRGKQVKQLIN